MKKSIRLSYITMILFLGLPQCAESQDKKNENDRTRQKDLIDLISFRAHRIHAPVSGMQARKLYFSFLPFGSSVAGGGHAWVTSTTAAFYLGDSRTTSLSAATFSPYFTFDGRFGYTLRTGIYLRNDLWSIKGDVRFLYYPQYTWGLGINSKDNKKILMKRHL